MSDGGLPTAILAAMLLSACAASTVESDFLCEAPVGAPCASIAESDGRDYAALGGVRERDASIRSAPQPIPFEDPPTLAGVPQTVIAGGALYGGEIVNPVLFREPERVTSVWIAPYVGQNGYLHQPGYVHFVVEEGRWFGPGGVEGGVRAPIAGGVTDGPALRKGRLKDLASQAGGSNS